MADSGTRLRNVSPYGDLDVPDLGIVVPYRHEVLVPPDLAEKLLATGNFTPVNRASDHPADTAAAGDGQAQDAVQTDQTSGASTAAETPEEQNQ